MGVLSRLQSSAQDVFDERDGRCVVIDRGGVRFAKAESDVRFGRVDLSASTRRQRIDEWGGVRLLEETGSDE